MIKKLSIGLLGLIALLVIAVVAVVMLVDVNRFKPTIQSFVKDNYQRTLTIDGDLSLKLYPRVAIGLPKSSLSEPNADSQAIALESASIGVAVLPLLTGKVEADKILLDGLNATIVRNADGSTSIDDLIGANTQAKDSAQSEPAADAGESAGLPEINLGGVELTNASVRFEDKVAANTVVLKNLNLKTGAIANNTLTPLSFTVDATTTNPVVALNLGVEGEVQPDLNAQSVKSPALTIDLKGKAIDMTIDQTVSLSALAASAASVSASQVKFSSRIGQQARKVVANLNFPLAYDLAAGVLNLKQFSGQVDVDDPALGSETVSLPFDGSATVDTNKQAVDLALNVSAPDTALKASVSVNDFARPKVQFDLAADRIDVDRYFPVSEEAAPVDDKSAKQEPAGPEPVIDLSFLNDINVAGKATIGQLIARGMKVSNVSLKARSAKGQMDLKPLTMDLYGGKFDGNASVAAKGNQVKVAAALDSVNVGPLIKDLTKDDLIEGNGNVKLNLTTAGKTVSQMKQGLNGTAAVSLLDGAIVGINLGQKIRDAKQMLSAGANQAEASEASQKTDFATLTASFKIVNGVAANVDLAGKSPLFRLGGNGEIDVAGGSINYTARASVVGTSKGQGGAEVQELRGVTLPVQLFGPFEALNWKINWKEAAELALKSKLADKLKLDEQKAKLEAKKQALKAQADAKKAELEQKKQAKTEELKDKAKEKLGNKLKGLLGG